jgi:hypothetical protein
VVRPRHWVPAGDGGKLFRYATMRPRSASVSALNVGDGMMTMLRPSGRTPWRINAASCVSLY